MEAPICAVDHGTAIAGITEAFAGAAPDLGAFESGEAVWSAGATRSADATVCGKIADVTSVLPPLYVSPWLTVADE